MIYLGKCNTFNNLIQQFIIFKTCRQVGGWQVVKCKKFQMNENSQPQGNAYIRRYIQSRLQPFFSVSMNYSKGRRFDSHHAHGQAYFSSLPGVDTHSEQHHKHHIYLSTVHQHRKNYDYQITLISKELDSVPKYHILEPT